MVQVVEVELNKQKTYEWLPHLTAEIVADARGAELEAYTIALEGWRRGLTLRWHVKNSEQFKEMNTWSVDNPGKLFSLSSKDKTHYFFRSRGDKVTNEAVELGLDKGKSKVRLIEAGVPTPNGKAFQNVKTEEIIACAKSIGFPIVIKPVDGSYGRGVLTNIKDELELEQAITHVRDELGYNDVLIEQYVPGDEYRIYVVGDQVVGAIKRIPAHVVGDGVNTVQSLIKLKNKERTLNPRLISCLIYIDEQMIQFVEKQGYTMESVLAKGEKLFLIGISNVSKGGEPISVTDKLSSEVKNIAVRALHAIPGLAHGAVDLIVNPNNSNEATVLELNPTAQLGGLLFPSEGKANDIPSAIIDYYFPETVNKRSVEQSKLYFDFMGVLYPLINRDAETTTVTPIPQGIIYAKKYTVSGDVQQIGYHRGLRKQTFERYLNGFVLNLKNGDIEVVVAGTDREMVEDFENGLWEDPERSDVKGVSASDWNKPIKVGFEIRGNIPEKDIELEKLLHEIERIESRLKKAERQYKNYLKSSSWKVSWPIRVIGKLFK